MNKITTSYDDLTDVLYVRAGDVRRTKNAEDEAGLVLRYDARTHVPVGATIIDYREYWLPKRKRLVARLAKFFDITATEADRALPKR